MARRCELSGKAVLTGNNVSHAKRRTKRRFLPNLCNVTLESEALKKRVRFTISAHALRSVEHRGGLDAYLLDPAIHVLASSRIVAVWHGVFTTAASLQTEQLRRISRRAA